MYKEQPSDTGTTLGVVNINKKKNYITSISTNHADNFKELNPYNPKVPYFIF